MREQGIVMFCTSLKQTLNIDHDNSVYGTGTVFKHFTKLSMESVGK